MVTTFPWAFTAQRNTTSVVLGFVIPSIRLSVTTVIGANSGWWVTPLPSKICSRSDPTSKKRRLRQISAYNVSTVRDSEKVHFLFYFLIKLNFNRIN